MPLLLGTSNLNMDDSIRRVEKLNLEEVEKVDEMNKNVDSFSPEEEKRLVRKLDLWYFSTVPFLTSTYTDLTGSFPL